MTVIQRLAVSSLLIILSTISVAPPWLLRVGGQYVPLDGRVAEGNAIEAFLNETWPQSNFTAAKTCTWNPNLIKCNNSSFNVIELNFLGLKLNGTIAANTLGNLSWLEKLDLSNNELNGPLPDDIGRLSNLTTLNLSRNSFEGYIPSSIQNFSALKILDFSFNLMTGPIPVVLNSLQNLTTLKLNGNSFIGNLSQDSFPVNLQELDLSQNNLTGPIPSSLFNNLKSLVHLRLGSNYLSGQIDSFVLQPGLLELDLRNNIFSGKIPKLGQYLQELYLNDNNLEGNVTELIESWMQVPSSLKRLDLSSNNLTPQSFPGDLSGFVSVERLGLADNDFFSHSFPLIPLNKSLQFLNLSGTNLSGSIPDWIGEVVQLVYLDLSRNDLSEGIPTKMAQLTNIELMNLSKNNLSGSIPAGFIDLTFLSSFNVSHNHLKGPIPMGNQFFTFANSSFLDNAGLCGFPLDPCTGSSAPVLGVEKKSTGPIIGGIISGIAVAFIVAAALFIWCRVSRAVKPLAKEESRHVSGPMLYEKDAETWARGIKDPNSIAVVMFEKPLMNLSFLDLLQATSMFSKEMQIADGGYGPVYKGVLADGTQLAIKVLVEVGFSDEKEATERIEGLSKVRHPNLVSLLGYCLVGQDSLLIHEYMVSGDLQQWLHELPEGTRNPEDWSRDTWEYLEGGEISGDHLSWPTRHKIALGTARALAFLHHGCSPHIIHRDVKSSNILLDEAFDAHLVDSGLAGIAKMNGTPIIGGTLGYVPPEYGQTWQATTRGDVYSFGVVLLELVTGRKPTGHYFHDSCGGNLVGWVRSLIKQDKRGQKALDSKLASRGYVSEMLETLRIGYLCTSETPSKRPTMQQVVGLLKDCQASLTS